MNILMKPVSGQCTMTCEYCFYCDEMKKRGEALKGVMTDQTLKNVVRKTLGPSREPVIFAYQGGEPLLRGIGFYREAVRLQQQYNRNRVPVLNAMQTNGMLLDDEWCSFFAANRFLVGFSLDGTEELHDRYRRKKDGSGSFRQVLAGIRCLEKWHAQFNILTVVTEDLAQKTEEVYSFYRQMGWDYQQYIACLDPSGETGTGRYSLSPGAYGDFLIRLFRCWEKDRRAGKEPYIRQFDNYIGILMGYLPEACEHRGKCGVQYAIEADGSVYPCDFYMTDAYLLGNINRERCEAIDSKRREIRFVEESETIPQRCAACAYYSLCRGGCRRNRTETDRTNRFCEGYRKFFDTCLEDMERIAKERR